MPKSSKMLPMAYCEEWDADSPITLDDLIVLAKQLQAKYGVKAQVWFDGGANNVQTMIRPTKAKE